MKGKHGLIKSAAERIVAIYVSDLKRFDRYSAIMRNMLIFH